ncbi:hypothetical protein [Ruminiclostridium cellobioparum]|uniref:hypothetical protein n=1 Tax=Ruminiclostridium cellobioparum TaxID=29355 RepID=UPI0028B10F4F|nr:hypothetical protein [Ruminiclostridium cellobioparum]
MSVQDEAKWIEAINKTGFDLEYRIQRILKHHNWHVMNNRYYVDDRAGTDREIDIVAYKVKYIENIVFYTYLIISCKKSFESNWVFLTSNQDSDDEDFDSYPIEMAFTDRGKKALIENEKTVMVEKLKEISSWQRIFDATHRVLSFQQINKKSFKNEDDKRIFSSIITTIKAAAYEKKFILEHNKENKDICINFNLLSIFEGGLKENYRNDVTNEMNDIQEVKYINRHIIDDTDRPYRVHFISDGAFEIVLEQYDQMADDIVDYYELLLKEVYENIFEEEKRYRIEKAWEDFSDEVAHDMCEEESATCIDSYFNNSWITKFEFAKEEQLLKNFWDFSFYIDPEAIVTEFNQYDLLIKITSEKLKKIFSL